MDADVERKGLEMELAAVRRQLRESRSVELQALEDELQSSKRMTRQMRQEIEDLQAAHESQLNEQRRQMEVEMER